MTDPYRLHAALRAPYERIRAELWREFIAGDSSDGTPSTEQSEDSTLIFDLQKSDFDGLERDIRSLTDKVNAPSKVFCQLRLNHLPPTNQSTEDTEHINDAIQEHHLHRMPEGWHVTRCSGFLDLADESFTSVLTQVAGISPEIWLRTISWCKSNADMRALVKLTHKLFFRHCGPPVTNWIWLVIETKANGTPETNRLVSEFPPIPMCATDTSVQKLRSCLNDSRCLVMWYRISQVLGTLPQAAPFTWLPQEHSRKIALWKSGEQIDREILRITSSWYRLTEIQRAMVFQDINLGVVREYDAFAYLLLDQLRVSR